MNATPNAVKRVPTNVNVCLRRPMFEGEQSKVGIPSNGRGKKNKNQKVKTMALRTEPIG
jgi:hypothetical protein